MQIPRNDRAPHVIDLDRLFEDLLVRPAVSACASVLEFAPALEVAESDDAYIVRAEVPGLKPEDVQVTVEDDVLTLRGEKRPETEVTDGKTLRTERRYGKFVRSVQLGSAVDAEQATATHRNGVLVVRLPKHARARAKQVRIDSE